MTIKTAQQLMKDNMIVKHYAGSHAYGTSLPTSDVDFRGIFVANPINVRTPFYRIEEVNDTTEEDTKLYELSQFMKLCLDCNPNIIETLHVDEQDVIFSTPAYELLRENAPKLLSSKIAYTTSGYALAQLKRIKGHNKWINSPQPQQAPQQVDYISLVHNFTPEQVFKINLRAFYEGFRLVPFSGDTFGLYEIDQHHPFNVKTGTLNVEFEGDSHELGTPLYIIKFNRQVYESAKETWANYWEWKKNRNEKRGELEEKFGYDTKHAMHCIRLLRMGAEALEEGVIKVRRPDAKELLAIRDGSWTYDEIVAYAERMDERIRNILLLKTDLPKTPDIKLAAELTLQVQDLVWGK